MKVVRFAIEILLPDDFEGDDHRAVELAREIVEELTAQEGFQFDAEGVFDEDGELSA